MSLVSCQKQEFQPNPEGTTITVNATVEDPIVTKTYVEELENAYAINWSESELNMQAFVWNESGYNKAESNEFTSNPDGTGTFNVTVPSGEWTNIAGIYPSSAVKETDEDTQTRMRTELPTIQNPSATSYDPAAYILIARPTALPESLEGFTWEAYYYRATALNKFMVTNLENGGNIVSVKITFPEGEKVSGYKRVNLTTAEVIEYNANNPNYVDLNYKAAPLAANEGGSYDLWFTTWTVNVPMESTGFTVEVTTEEYKYTKTFIPKQDGFVLEENAINIVPVNMTGAEIEAIDPAEDFSGEYLIISHPKSGWTYMTAQTDSDNEYFISGQTNINIDFEQLNSNDFIGVSGIEDNVWTIQKTDGGYTIYNAKCGYLQPDDNSSKNYAHASTDAVTLYLEAGENGTAIIKKSNTATKFLQYNNSSPRFACYKDGQTDIYLLPWSEPTEPILIVSETSKTVAADAAEVVFEYTARNLTGAVTATVASDESQIISGSPVVDAAASTVTVTLNPNTEEVEKTATITISANTVGVEDQTLTIIQQAYAPLADIVLTFPDDNKDNNKCSAYNKSWTAISGSHEFNIENFNNNNWNNWTYIRCGSRNDASVGTISNVTSMPKIASIAVTVDKITTTEVNSIFLSIYSDEGLATQIGSNIAPNEGITSGTLTFNIPAEYQVSNQYYELSFDCQKGKSNGIIQISKVEYAVTE